MCPRPKGWSEEQWREYQDRRGGRVVLMQDYMLMVMHQGATQSEAFRQMEDALRLGDYSLEEGLDEATERWVTARKERYGY
jgi:hypothetical protein